MEHLWSRAGANGGDPAQVRQRPKRPRQAESVASGRRQLRAQRYGKEGVDGSSPSEGFWYSPADAGFSVSEPYRSGANLTRHVDPRRDRVFGTHSLPGARGVSRNTRCERQGERLPVYYPPCSRMGARLPGGHRIRGSRTSIQPGGTGRPIRRDAADSQRGTTRRRGCRADSSPVTSHSNDGPMIAQGADERDIARRPLDRD